MCKFISKDLCEAHASGQCKFYATSCNLICSITHQALLKLLSKSKVMHIFNKSLQSVQRDQQCLYQKYEVYSAEVLMSGNFLMGQPVTAAAILCMKRRGRIFYANPRQRSRQLDSFDTKISLARRTHFQFSLPHEQKEYFVGIWIKSTSNMFLLRCTKLIFCPIRFQKFQNMLTFGPSMHC